MNADQIAGLPGGALLRPVTAKPPVPILRSQDEANRACERVGWVTIHPNKATKEATMSTTTTTTTTKLTLSCGHVKAVEGNEIPAVGDKVHCGKCPGRANGEMALRKVKTIGGPGQPLASHEADVAREAARNADLPSRQDTTEALTEALTLDDTTRLEQIVEKVEASDEGAEVITFASRPERMAAAREAAKAAAASGGDKAAASERVLSMPIKQAPVENRSSTAPRPRTGRLAFLNLSPVRNEAIAAALGAGVKVGKDGEDIASRDLLVAVTNEAPTVDLFPASVRVLLRNLPRVAGDTERPEKVRNAAGRLAEWLTKHAEAAGYSS